MPNIKEIALKLLAKKFPWMRQANQTFMVEFAEALIESYKAELLKGVGEPVLYAEFAEDGGWLGDASEYADYLEEPHALFTSDQVSAAVLNATKPLIEERDRAVKRMEAGWIEVCDSGILAFKEMNDELRAKLAAAQEEIERLKATPPDKREDLRCVISDLCHQVRERDAQLAKAEQLWQVAQGRCDGLEEKLAKAEQRVAEYNELIYAVQTKHHDETRHQTALRYIRNAENRPSNTVANGASS